MAIGNTLIFILVIVVGGIGLQIFLSRRESKILGLILPFLSFLYSLVMVFNIVAFDMSIIEILGFIVTIFFIGNIPTIILMAVYIGCREKIKRNKEIEKMNIQDLE